MQDFVRVGVADSAEDVRIGQRSFQGVIVSLQRFRECRQIDLEHLDAPGIVLRQCLASANDMERRLTLTAGFGEQQRPVVEVEGEQSDLPRDPGSLRLPAETTRNHQVEDEVQLMVEREDHPFAKPMEVLYRVAFDRGDRRVDGSEKES